ncbi:uncharacterized protein FFB20_03585 [Fusarium fujikuroi]|uniref:Uncharacterized protein n=1 Tax=Fusarium proliferatum (strain ET1) TaxID=1227346 RepID=A0A1L7V3H4_FUSPR|nr:uncharacterized protein FPRO_00418 [Fusarium proliferatum ET1]SCN69824.1 uncharacterized protein FFB20_03585 [Fusarium fujikuroi]CZR35459.1 uncharacterized protein FPRO_00418 [Fusarium proliferatum ET1]SCN73557.1 uncharacterized protein FFC1_01819 [Fusarium fujikuroi]SCO07890.1 uncharacterized protein FFE2_11394 [Fusarium fujikuroi]SCO11823.1 uncharacterized protein FFM5_10121 [Fusarium fujikuroi]
MTCPLSLVIPIEIELCLHEIRAARAGVENTTYKYRLQTDTVLLLLEFYYTHLEEENSFSP